MDQNRSIARELAPTPHLAHYREIPVAFLQDGPQLAHPWRSDRLLRGLLDRLLPDDRRTAIEPDLDALGDYSHSLSRR